MPVRMTDMAVRFSASSNWTSPRITASRSSEAAGRAGSDEASLIGGSIPEGGGSFLERLPDAAGIAVLHFRALDQQDVNGLRPRVGPALRAVGATVAERSGREHRGHAGRILHDLEPETPAHAFGEAGLDVAALRGGHEPGRPGLEVNLAARGAAVEHHLVKLREIARGGEQPAGGDRGAAAVTEGAPHEVEVGLGQ